MKLSFAIFAVSIAAFAQPYATVGSLMTLTETSSSGTTYTWTVTPALTRYPASVSEIPQWTWRVGASCSGGAITGQIGALGAHPIVNRDGSNPATTQCAVGTTVVLSYDNSLAKFIMISPEPQNSTGLQPLLPWTTAGDLVYFDGTIAHRLAKPASGTWCVDWSTSVPAWVVCPGATGSGADANAYYLVSRATNAPVNALNLGALSTGLLKLTVASSIATPSTATVGVDYMGMATAIVRAQTPLTTKGDLWVTDGTSMHRLAVGANGTVLTGDSTQTDGMRWVTASGLADPCAVTVAGDTVTVPTSCNIQWGQGVPFAAPAAASCTSHTGPGTMYLGPLTDQTWACLGNVSATVGAGMTALTGTSLPANMPCYVASVAVDGSGHVTGATQAPQGSCGSTPITEGTGITFGRDATGALAISASAAAALGDPGANGIVKRTALNVTTTAAASDIVALWTTCGSNFMKGDGTCANPSGSGDVVAAAGNTFTGYNNFSGGRIRLPEATFASPPSTPLTGQEFLFTDASSAGVCSGGGSAFAICRYSGSAYQAIGGGGTGGGGTQGERTFTTSGTFDCTNPAGDSSQPATNRVFVEAWGGGGAGVCGLFAIGPGGPGGGYAASWVTCSGSITVTIGAGGVSGTNCTTMGPGWDTTGNGGTSSFGTAVVALGGTWTVTSNANTTKETPGYDSKIGNHGIWANSTSQQGTTGFWVWPANSADSIGLAAVADDQGGMGSDTGGSSPVAGWPGGSARRGGGGGGGGAMNTSGSATTAGGAGGTSGYGGAGGNGSSVVSGVATHNCTAGSVPGGGGGGGAWDAVCTGSGGQGCSGCDGGAGKVIVRW